MVEQGVMNLANTPFIKGVSGAYTAAAMNGFGGLVARAGEGLNDMGIDAYGALSKIKQAYPGQSDQFYKDRLHQIYNQAETSARNDAQQQVKDNPYPGHQVGNFVGSVLGSADPTWLINPGEGVAKALGLKTTGTLAARIAGNAATHAAIGSGLDDVYQLADIATGMAKQYDVKRNLESAAFAGAFGAAHPVVSDFVTSLFANRGVDTTPNPTPMGRTTPLTGGQPTPEVAKQINDAWHTGNEQDIFNAYQGTNITPPKHADIHEFVKNRDNPEVAPPVPPPLGEVDQRQAVQDHITNLTAGWKNSPDFEVINHIGDIQDPHMLAHALDQHADDPGVLGFVAPDNKVRIFANKIDSPETLNAVVYHEALGHYGLQQTFGNNLDSTLRTLTDRNVGQFGRDVTAWQKANPGAYGGDRTRAAEEVLAEMSQSGTMKPVLSDAITSTLRRFGRKMGLNLSYSDAEVRNILAMAHDAVINGKGRDVRANGFNTNSVNKNMFIGQKATGFDPNHPTAFTGSDGNVRNEISDQGADISGPRMGTLGQTMSHPDLYEQYPQLRDVKTVHTDMSGSGLSGAYSPKTNRMYLNTHDPDPRSTILHETQHAIQHIEGQIGPEDGNQHASYLDYERSPIEQEARATEARAGMSVQDRADNPISFMRKDALGRELTDPEKIDELERLKANPRFWSDPDYRRNVLELARTQFPASMKQQTVTPQYRTEAEARADGTLNFMNRSQLAASKDYVSDDLERIYHSLDEHYTPTTQTWDEVRRAALSAGFKPSQIKDLGSTEGLSVKLARMQAAANMADMKLSELNNRLGTKDWTMADQMAYISTLADSHYLNARVKGTRADIARALNVSKVARSYSNATMDEVAERLRAQGSGLASLADDPVKFMQFAQSIKDLMNSGNKAGARIKIAGVDKPYWEQYLSSFHFNAMLSALSTHVKAPLDMMTGIGQNVIDHALAYPIGKLYNTIESLTGQKIRPGVPAEEAVGRIWGAMRSVFSHEVYVKTLHAAQTGEGSVVLPNGRTLVTAAKDSYGASGNPRIGLLSKPTDLITAQDTFFRSHAVAQELYGLGYRQAAQDLKNSGKPYTPDDVATLGASYAHNPTPKMLTVAQAAGEKSLLLNTNQLTGWLDKARGYHPNMTVPERIGAFTAQNLAPFLRVASNSLLTRTIERSPLPLLNPDTWKTLAAGGPDAHTAIARMAYGTIKLGLMWGAAAETKDLLTGEGPDNADKRKELQAGGWAADAVHENGRYNTGGTLNMSLNPFDMHNSTAQMIKDMRKAYEEGISKNYGPSWINNVGVGLKLALGSVLHDFEESSWIHDVAPALAAVDARGEGAGQQLSQFVGNEAKTFVPNGINQLNRTMFDPNQRDTTPDEPGNITAQMANSVKSAIPGLSQTLPLKYSVYGDPMPTGASATGVHTVIPGLEGNGQQETTDPAKQELERLAKLVPSAIITPVAHTINGTRLTTEQFENYQHEAGTNIVNQVSQVMSTPQWQQMSDQDKIITVRAIQSAAKKAAKEKLFGQ